MSPNKSEEEKVKMQAEEFLNSNYDGEYEIYDVLYDNMGNFNYLKYAAMVRDKSTEGDFLIYYNDELQKNWKIIGSLIKDTMRLKIMWNQK